MLLFYELRDFGVAEFWIFVFLFLVDLPKGNKSATPGRLGAPWSALLATFEDRIGKGIE